MVSNNPLGHYIMRKTLNIEMCGINYLTMKEVAKKLKMKTDDAAARWCLNNNIDIITLGNKRVVSEYDFKLAYEQPMIDILKKKYKKKWVNYSEAYNSGDVRKFYELKENIVLNKEEPVEFNPNTFLNDIGYERPKNT